MAERRMFAKTIVMSDAFLDMPPSTRCLYFGFGMMADDDGFVNSPKSIMRQVGASPDDINILVSKRFIIPFDSGVIVLKHWKINNYIRNDRYQETKYIEERSSLMLDAKGAYTELTEDGTPLGIPNDNQRYTQDRIGEERIGKDTSFIHSAPNDENEESETCVENDVENSDKPTSPREYLGGIGKGVVFLNDEQIGDLIDKLGIEEFDYYVGIVADCELKGKSFRKKTHYQAILDMALKDRKIRGGAK